jgi:tRNA-dihydrouridine synthase A
MMDFTDRFCRFFHRRLSNRARLYTEMVTTGALIHGPRDRLLAFDSSEHPVALQLGGSEPDDLARCAAMGEAAGYDEINLNCGCPSERVQRGAFGACLMAEPALVADCVKAMVDRVSIPVTVKHRIGLDQIEEYGFVRDFVGTVAAAGCSVFIVHARNAWLKGLSPRENREIPPLRYGVVQQLKRDFPGLVIVLNGGLRDHETAIEQMQGLDGVMLGRAACESPWLLASVDSRYYGQTDPRADRIEAAESMIGFVQHIAAEGVPARAALRHLLGLFNGLPGARQWRRTLSDARLLHDHGASLLEMALAPMRSAVTREPAFLRRAVSADEARIPTSTGRSTHA